MNNGTRFVILGTAIVAMLAVRAPGADLVRWGHGWRSSASSFLSLTSSVQKVAHTIVPEQNMSISQIAVRLGSMAAGTPQYRIGVQGDDGSVNHNPDGAWVGGLANYDASNIPASKTNSWLVSSLPAAAPLTAGVRYHLVIESSVADASNYRSIMRCVQSPLQPFRVNDGVYDAAVGKESYNGSTWSRADAFPIVAIDTNTVTAVGQPWTGVTSIYRVNSTNRLGQVFTLAAPGSPSGRFYLRAMGMFVSTNATAPTPVPNDDLRIHLMRTSDNTELASSVLMPANQPQSYAMIMTNLPASTEVMVENGQRYLLYCESDNLSNNNYMIIPGVGSTNDYVGAAAATFQGTNGYFATSINKGPWVWKSSLSGCESDLVFELQLEPARERATLITVR